MEATRSPIHASKNRKRKKNRSPAAIDDDDDDSDNVVVDGDEGVRMNPKNLLREAEEAARLESILFGKLRDPSSLEFGHEFDDGAEALIGFQKEEEEGEEEEEEGEEEDLGEVVERETSNGRTRQPVWEDEEENEARVNISNVNRLRKLLKVGEDGTVSGKEYVARLRDFHGKLNPGVQWAKLPSAKASRNAKTSSESDESDDENYGYGGDESVIDGKDDGISKILKSTDDLVVKNKGRLPPGIIGISRMRDANAEEPSNGVIQSVQFHRNAQILLSAGFDKRIRLFQVDGKRNAKIQSIFLDDFPIQKASFVPDGSKVICSGRRRFYYVYDLTAGATERMEPLFGRTEKSLESFEVSSDAKTVAFLGSDGYILLASLKSKQLIGTMKMNGSVRAISFSRGGKELLSLGGDGEVYQWDIGTRKCMYKGRDDGCIKGTTLASSHDSSLFATGSSTGVVNLYDREKFVNGHIEPTKSFMNLLTTVHTLKFNPDAQILAMASKMKQGALKLVHLPSRTVFSNWPTMRTPLHFVHTMDFSPGGGFLAAGNAAGKVLLFRLRHYETA